MGCPKHHRKVSLQVSVDSSPKREVHRHKVITVLFVTDLFFKHDFVFIPPKRALLISGTPQPCWLVNSSDWNEVRETLCAMPKL